jgi:prephenate dehydrogenase
MIERIAILGTGLLGTSVGLALRAAGFRGSITGWNRSPEGAQTRSRWAPSTPLQPTPCRRRGRARSFCWPCPSTPRSTWMEKLAACSARSIWSPTWAAPRRRSPPPPRRLFNTPDRAAFLPGHPMAGKERGGAALGDAELFRGAVWLFTDDPAWQRSPHSAALVKGWREWVAAMGSKTLDIDPAPR